MIFKVDNELKKRYPEKNIYLFSSMDYKRPREEKEQYTFSIMSWDWNTRFAMLKIPALRFQKENRIIDHNLKEILSDAACFIDISGYALSSQWGWFASIKYLSNIAVAKKFNIKYYIFPQSIGPFAYSLWQRALIYPLLRKYLSYPEKVYVREQDGFKWCEKFTKKNLEHQLDIVLQNKEVDLSLIYKKPPVIKEYMINENSVGIIPNARVAERMNRVTFRNLHKTLIEKVLENNFSVYIFRHSYEDMSLCVELKSLFQDEDNVIVIYDDFNAIELEHLVRKFDFIIASRYHSIIHAYKNSLPAIVIGWATKYRELLKNFGQLEYWYDCRTNFELKSLENKLKSLIINGEEERNKIKNSISRLYKRNIKNPI